MIRGSYRTVLLRLAIVAGATMIAGIAIPRLRGEPVSEYEVKAAYLYNFGRFVEWPPTAPAGRTSDFSICVLGRDPFGAALDSTISGETIAGKSVVARRVAKVDEATSCRILFISSSEAKQIKEILPMAGKFGVLTVSDLPEFVQQGGMVQFILTDNRVRFSINLAAARQAGLSLSSELLKVAVVVRGKPGSGD